MIFRNGVTRTHDFPFPKRTRYQLRYIPKNQTKKQRQNLDQKNKSQIFVYHILQLFKVQNEKT